MKVSQLIGGIICLVLAVFITILGFTLSPDKMMFMVGKVNIVAIILGIIGLVLLFTARRGKKEAN